MNPVVEIVIVLGMVLFTGSLAAISLGGLLKDEPWKLDSTPGKREKVI